MIRRFIIDGTVAAALALAFIALWWRAHCGSSWPVEPAERESALGDLLIRVGEAIAGPDGEMAATT